VAAERPVACVILEAPFTSAVDVGARHYWFVPVWLFMKDQFRSDLRAPEVRAPVLILHGEKDAVVPIDLGKRLYSLIHAPRRFITVTDAGHNNPDARHDGSISNTDLDSAA
jgi:pimeloyl-ACP methyl ester carboxylesterase